MCAMINSGRAAISSRAVHLSPGRVEGAHLRRVKDVNYPLTGPSERFHSILIVSPTTHATSVIHSISQPFPNLSCIDQTMRAAGFVGKNSLALELFIVKLQPLLPKLGLETRSSGGGYREVRRYE